MLLEWLQPAIDNRLKCVFTECGNDSRVATANRAYQTVLEKVKSVDPDLYSELDESVNALRADEQLVTYRAGLIDGIALQNDIVSMTNGQKGGELLSPQVTKTVRQADSNRLVETVTRTLAEIAKQADGLGWELHDLFKRKRIVDYSHLLHHSITDSLLELIHDINGVPKEGENGFTRDILDDDFMAYFADDICLDECMRRYAARLCTLKL